jgi:group I intron endonuclease
MSVHSMGEIYVITSPTGKQYVGQCEKTRKNGYQSGYLSRWKAHVRESQLINPKKAGCTYLNRAIVKYGPNSMKLEILEECSSIILDEREKYYIRNLNTMAPNGYNLTSGGQGTIELSEVTRKKISEKKKGQKPSMETREKMRQAHLGIGHTDETKELLRELAKRPRNFKPRELPQYISFLNHEKFPGYSVRIPKEKARIFRVRENGRNLDEALEEAIQYRISRLEEKGSTTK